VSSLVEFPWLEAQVRSLSNGAAFVFVLFDRGMLCRIQGLVPTYCVHSACNWMSVNAKARTRIGVGFRLGKMSGRSTCS
jgi:hypothetical protein